MIASPEMTACAGSPRTAWPDAASAAPAPTQNTSPNAASSSANARRGSVGRSGKDGFQRDADDLQAPREPAEGKRAQVLLGDTEHVGAGAVTGARGLERFGDMR